MKQPIKFRGQGWATGEWYYGGIYHNTDANNIEQFYIVKRGFGDTQVFVRVNPQTVGQFTGLHDKDFNEIYDGDIVRIYDYMNRRVVFERGAFCYATKFGAMPFAANPCFRHTDDGGCRDIEVIGNVYDNSELIEKIE